MVNVGHLQLTKTKSIVALGLLKMAAGTLPHLGILCFLRLGTAAPQHQWRPPVASHQAMPDRFMGMALRGMRLEENE